MKYYLLAILSLFLLFTSCKRFLELDNPSTDLSVNAVFNSDATTTGAQTAIYSQMENEGFIYNLITATGLSADEFVNYSNTSESIDLATNNLNPENTITLRLWSNAFKYIYQANAILEGLENSANVSLAAKQRLTGEAKFTRAFCYYLLVNLFGDVPILRTTNYRANTTQKRAPQGEVYNFIIEDLQSSVSSLSEEYVSGNNSPTNERVRPNKWAATALLSKVYLHLGKWAEAESEATKIISASSLYSLSSNLANVFLKNSNEAIWQLMATAPFRNSYPGAFLILTSTPNTVSLRTDLVNSFDNQDKRKTTWINSITIGSQKYFYPFKYTVGQNAPTVTEYTMIFRIGEQYLIRAESRGRQNNLVGAYEDLNKIRNRAGLSPIPVATFSEFMDSLNKERKLELFSEMSDRWLNLKRTNTINQVLSVVKGSNWQSTDQLYPIPLTEILRNPALTQNPGY